MGTPLRFDTPRYEITVEEKESGGPGGYESTYLTSEGVPASDRLYALLTDKMPGRLLAAEHRMIRQRNGEELEKALEANHPVGIASGFKPSGAYHFGHRLVSSTLSYFQRNGALVCTPIADIECQMDARMSEAQYVYWAADNLLDWGANGVDLDAAHVYLQSEETRVNVLAYAAARNVSLELAVDIYGYDKMHEDLPFLLAGLAQVGDILLPQHPSFGNQHSFMVSGQDQDGHMKMTVALLERSTVDGREVPGLKTTPSAFYIPHVRGLTGAKASSSKHDGTLYLGCGPNKLDLAERIRAAKSTLDDARGDDQREAAAQKSALDLVRYVDFFNDRSKVDWQQLREGAPEGATPDALDDYLMSQCAAAGQDNLQLVSDSIAEALTDHQLRRQAVLDYALGRADPPEFWSATAPQRAERSGDEQRTTWAEMVSAARDDLLP